MSGSPRVFVVEDETMVLFHLEDMLSALGCTIVGPAMRLEAALDLAQRGDAADLAILDVNIGGQKVFPVAEVLRDRGVPVVFATGYGREGLPAAWADRPVLVKPYTQKDIASAIAAALA
jgi:CheY-like chemotaxis protein